MIKWVALLSFLYRLVIIYVHTGMLTFVSLLKKYFKFVIIKTDACNNLCEVIFNPFHGPWKLVMLKKMVGLGEKRIAELS